MADAKNDVTRRDAIKTLGGAIVTLPVLGSTVAAQNKTAHDHMNHSAQIKAAPQKAAPLKFFTADENRLVVEMSERIIPADDHSPGAKAAGVAAYIDSIIDIANEETKKHWREGIAAVNKMSRDKYGKDFADASEAQQVELLTAISKNEFKPQTLEERFFKSIKDRTIDGYYTSKIGIHEELKYRGNTYLKEFTGCTHPEHQQGS
ncbi:MAG: gluconate 2-dehydrogenase subunit 3 family protein [Acidobacteriota bacterium]